MAMKLQTSTSRPALAARASTGPARFMAVPAVPVARVANSKVMLPYAPVVQKSQARKDRIVVASSDASANFEEGIAGRNDYSPLLAVIGFAAVWFNKFSVDRVKLLQALAILQLATTAVNLVSRRGVGDKVTAFVGPAVLASAVLSLKHVTYLDAATGLFGYFLSENLEAITGVPFYAFLATLAVALYLGYGTLWYVVAFGVAAAGKVYNSTKNSDPVPVVVLPALAASIFAIWKEAHFPLALSIYLAQTVWSGFGVIDALSKRVQD